MAQYRNTKNGAVVDVTSVVSGTDWEPVSQPEPEPAPEKAKTTRAKKKPEEAVI